MLAFADILRLRGVEATVDVHLLANPPTNWNVWRGEQASAADFLLLIISQSLYIRLTQSGSQNPDTETLQSIVFGSPRNKVILVFLNQEIDDRLVPPAFWGSQSYAIRTVNTDSGTDIDPDYSYIALYSRLTRQHKITPVGPVVHYSEQEGRCGNLVYLRYLSLIFPS